MWYPFTWNKRQQNFSSPKVLGTNFVFLATNLFVVKDRICCSGCLFCFSWSPEVDLAIEVIAVLTETVSSPRDGLRWCNYVTHNIIQNVVRCILGLYPLPEYCFLFLSMELSRTLKRRDFFFNLNLSYKSNYYWSSLVLLHLAYSYCFSYTGLFCSLCLKCVFEWSSTLILPNHTILLKLRDSFYIRDQKGNSLILWIQMIK